MQRAGDGKKAVVDPISCMCGALSMKATKGSVNGSKSSVVQCKVCQQLHHTACINYQPNESDDFVCIKCLLENVSTWNEGNCFVSPSIACFYLSLFLLACICYH